MTRNENRKNEIIQIALTYKDENGDIDLGKMRTESRSAYSQISYYFGGIDNFLESIGVKRSTLTGGNSTNKNVTRNKLAYDMLKYLHKEKGMNFAQISDKYGVSRAYMGKLYKEMEELFEGTQTAEDLKDVE